MHEDLPRELDGHVFNPERSAVPPGWFPLLVRMHAEMLRVTPDYRLLQVKEKFGSLRVYVAQEFPPAVLAQLKRCAGFSVAQAWETCELCGSAGRPRPPEHWVRCDVCTSSSHTSPT